LSKARRV